MMITDTHSIHDQDTYDAHVETDRTQKDRIRFYDTKGLMVLFWIGTIKAKRPVVSLSDAEPPKQWLQLGLHL